MVSMVSGALKASNGFLHSSAVDVEMDSNSSIPPRYLARLTMRYFLETALNVADLFHGDLMLGIVFMTIAEGNVHHIGRSDALEYAKTSGGAPQPDLARRPQTAYQIAKQLGVPYETVRRYIKKLVAEGWCDHLRSGFVVTQAAMSRPAITRSIMRNKANFDRLLDAIEGRELEEAEAA